jgi:hypothetical protein
MKKDKPSACSEDTRNEYIGGTNKYQTPITQMSEANHPGPRPPYQALRITAASGSW